jgi:uncharacterized membrane protein
VTAGLRAIVFFALTAASWTLFGWELFSDASYGFLKSNTLPPVERKQLMVAMIGAACLVGAVLFAYVALFGRRAVERVNIAARIAAPLVLAGLVIPITDVSIWNDALEASLAVAAFVILFERLLSVSLAAMQEWMSAFSRPRLPERRTRQRRIATVVVLAAAAGYAAYFSRYTVFAHWRFQTYNYDLGQYDNIFWNALHGRPNVCSPLGWTENWSSLAGHADLGVYFFLPFYAIYPHAEALLVLQSVVLALGAIPVYFFAAKRLHPYYAALIAVAYLLFPPLHGANFYDFHFQPIASTFVLFTIWLVDLRRWFWASLTFVIALSCREDISVGLTFFGIYLVLSRHRPLAGALIAVVAALYFVVIRFHVMAAFGPGWFSDIYKDLYPKPNGPNTYGGVMQTLATNPTFVFHTLLTPDKLRYFLQILAPVAFLPLRRAYLLPALIPGAMFTLLTTAYGPTTDIGFQYSGHFTPYLFMASSVALASCVAHDRLKARATVATVALATFLCTRYWGAVPPNPSFRGGFSVISFATPTPADRIKKRDLATLLAMIPEGATFAVSEQELPHASGRRNVFSLRDGTGEMQYLLYGVNSAGANHGQDALSSGNYVEVATRPGLVLLKHK